MRFQVPQFIEVEDKIFGPLTIKQFLYLAGALGMVAVVYALVGNLFLTIFVSLPIIGIGLALSFYKINNRPLIFVIEAAFKYYFADKLYVWRKKAKTPEHIEKDGGIGSFYVPKLSDSKLKDLTWNLDIKQIENPLTAQSGRKNV